jgi:hypothetical protein
MRTCIPVDRIEIGIAEILPKIAVDLIRSGLDVGLQDSAGGVTKLCAEIACLQAELGERIRRRPSRIKLFCSAR